MEILSTSEEQTINLGNAFGKQLLPGTVVAFYGELGTGKTTFIKGVVAGLGIEDKVTSPTFMFMKMYVTPQKASVFHIDLYRTDSLTDIKMLGLPELVAQENAIVLIEWADKMAELLPENTVHLHFSSRDEQKLIVSDAPQLKGLV